MEGWIDGCWMDGEMDGMMSDKLDEWNDGEMNGFELLDRLMDKGMEGVVSSMNGRMDWRRMD